LRARADNPGRAAVVMYALFEGWCQRARCTVGQEGYRKPLAAASAILLVEERRTAPRNQGAQLVNTDRDDPVSLAVRTRLVRTPGNATKNARRPHDRGAAGRG